MHVRATKLLLVLPVEKFFCKFHFLGVEGGDWCHLVLSFAGVQLAFEMSIASGGVDAVLLSQSCTHTSFSERVQIYAK